MTFAANLRAGAHTRYALACALIATTACTRHAVDNVPNDAARANAAPSASADDANASAGANEKPLGFLAPPPEARRVRVDKPLENKELAPFANALKAHFGEGARGPLLVQVADLENGRRAYFFRVLPEVEARDTDASTQLSPLFIVASSRGEVLWTKERPVAGITPKVGDVTIAPGPLAGAALFLYDPPTKIVAARMWDADGQAFAELRLFDMDPCDAVSVAYWPGHGWVVVASNHGPSRAQLLNEENVSAWGGYGVAIGPSKSDPSASPVAIAIDTDKSVMFAQALNHRLIVSRYDAHGVALWAAPQDAGESGVFREGDRIVATRVHEGLVAVTLPNGRSFDVHSELPLLRH